MQAVFGQQYLTTRFHPCYSAKYQFYIYNSEMFLGQKLKNLILHQVKKKQVKPTKTEKQKQNKPNGLAFKYVMVPDIGTCFTFLANTDTTLSQTENVLGMRF